MKNSLKLLKNKNELVKSIRMSGKMLNSDNWLYITDYIEKNLDLPDLEGKYEYILQWPY